MHLKMVPATGTYLPKSTSAEEFFSAQTDLAVKLLIKTRPKLCDFFGHSTQDYGIQV
jgi:hypothetical protein